MSDRRLKINIVDNLLSPIVRIAVGLITLPILLRHIGDARYGVMSIVLILLGVFGFLDLGLSRAVTNSLAKLRDAAQPVRARVQINDRNEAALRTLMRENCRSSNLMRSRCWIQRLLAAH